MTTQSERIDAKIKSLREQLNAPAPKPTIEERIKAIRESLNESSRKTVDERIEEVNKHKEEDPTDKKIRELRAQLNGTLSEHEQRRNTFLGEEKRLLAKIEAKKPSYIT